MARRNYGTGNLRIRRGSWYGQWWVGDRRIQRKLGPVRQPGTRQGLTRKMAEVELRRRIEATEAPKPTSKLTVTEAGERLLLHLDAIGRKPTTLATYRSQFTSHLAPDLGEVPLDRVTPEQIEGLIAEMRRGGSSPKTIVNALTLLHQIFAFAQRKRWCAVNPCEVVDRPRVEGSTEIHFLTADEIEALLRAVPLDHPYGPTDHALYLTAVMSGLRQGELLALRWRDIDWMAGRIRVRRNYVRGHWVSPKSKRGIRSVPLADRLAGELERHFQRSNYQGDDDLVFGHPHTGEVLDHSALVRRFKAALRAAKIRQVRFNDLRHSFATTMAAAGVPMRTLQEWMGHRDYKTTLIYADYAPSAGEAELVERAFAVGTNRGTNLSASESNSEQLKPPG